MAEASRDRQELWRLDNFLAVNGTNPGQHERRLRLYRYLCATCEHEWSDVSGWGGCPKGTRQCQWCNLVALPGDKAPKVGSEDAIQAWDEMNARPAAREATDA